MKNNDILQRFIFDNFPVRGEYVKITHALKTILGQHDYPDAIKKILGEALVLTVLMAATIKFKGRLTLQFQGSNQLKLLLVQSNHDFHIRGLAEWSGEVTDEVVLHDLQQGVLVIMIDPEEIGQRYQGVVSWKGNSLAEAIEGYFQTSEQLKTRIWLGMNEEFAVGMLLQSLPSEQKNGLLMDDPWERLTILTQTITQKELIELPLETILHRLYIEDDVRLFQAEPVLFQCTCSQRRGENAILMLGQKEAQEELNARPFIEVKCEFCNRTFNFDRVDVAKIFKNDETPPSSSQLH